MRTEGGTGLRVSDALPSFGTVNSLGMLHPNYDGC